MKGISRIAILFLGLFLVASCGKNKRLYAELNGFTQGTTYHIVYLDPAYINYSNDIDLILNKIDALFSSYNSTSLVCKFNQDSVSFVVHPEFAKLVHRSLEIHHSTYGAFDLTVAPLVKHWGFGPDETPVADTQALSGIMNKVGFSYIYIHGDTVFKRKGGVTLDFNAIAQGYTVDKVAEFFDSAGVVNYLVEIGGEVRTRGVNRENVDWKVGIDKPIDGNYIQGENIQVILPVSNTSIATSGNYRKFYIHDGQKYSHTISPFTGYPARNELLSATIIAPSCADADAFATACMVLGLDNSLHLIDSLNLGAYLVYMKKDSLKIYNNIEVFE